MSTRFRQNQREHDIKGAGPWKEHERLQETEDEGTIMAQCELWQVTENKLSEVVRGTFHPLCVPVTEFRALMKEDEEGSLRRKINKKKTTKKGTKRDNEHEGDKVQRRVKLIRRQISVRDLKRKELATAAAKRSG